MSSIRPKHLAPSRAKSGADRRRSHRTAEEAKAFMYSPTAAANGPKIAVASLHVSKHGVNFSVDHAVPVGTYFKLDLMTGAKAGEREILILHCKPLAEGKFGVGAEFA